VYDNVKIEIVTLRNGGNLGHFAGVG